jgi:hypothetical protein
MFNVFFENLQKILFRGKSDQYDIEIKKDIWKNPKKK